MLKHKGLIKKTSYVPKGMEYPYFTEALDFNNIHQADLVGQRYIKRDGRFYSLNVMDRFNHRVYIESQRTKQDRPVAAGLLRCWKVLGPPDYLQLDNELSFRGSNIVSKVLWRCDQNLSAFRHSASFHTDLRTFAQR